MADPIGILPPTTEPDALPTVCIEVNEEWIPYILGLLKRFQWKKTWDADDAALTLVHSRVEKLILLFMEGNCVIAPQFRQKPDNSCILQASYDSGASWTDVFDYSLCQPEGVTVETTISPLFRQKPTNDCILQASYDEGVTWTDVFDYSLCQFKSTEQTVIENSTIINESNEYIENITNIYNGTPGSVAPDMVYDSTEDDLFRDEVLCLAVQLLIEAVCLSAIEILEKKDQQNDSIINLVGIAVGALALLAGALLAAIGSGGILLPFAVALVGSMFGYVATLTSADISAFENEEAKEDVYCCFYNNIKGQTVTQAVFQGGLSGCSFTDDAEKIGNALAAALLEQDVYLLFLRLIQQVYVPGNVVGLPPCPCDEWCEFQDFVSVGDYGWNAEHGTYQSGTGWISATNVVSNRTYTVVEIILSTQQFYMTSAKMTFNLNEVAPPGAVLPGSVSAWLNGEKVADETVDPLTSGTNKIITLDYEGYTDEIKLQIYADNQPVGTPSGGSAVIKDVEICGLGVNPLSE